MEFNTFYLCGARFRALNAFSVAFVRVTELCGLKLQSCVDLCCLTISIRSEIDKSFMIYARRGPHEEKTGRKKDNILEKLTVFHKNGQSNHVFWKQGVPGGPYEAKAAKIFARGTRSFEC